jgi:hypothetical protein
VQVAAGDSVKIPDDKSKLQIVTLSEGVPQHLRYGYIIVDKPGVTEDPGWYPEPLPSSLLPINSSRTTSSKL